MTNKERIRLLAKEQMLQDEDLRALLTSLSEEEEQLLYQQADKVRRQYYGNTVYLRGLIEFSNYCRNDCLYCGLRRSNRNCDRYRLTKNRSSNAPTTDINWGSARSFYRAVKTRIIPTS